MSTWTKFSWPGPPLRRNSRLDTSPLCWAQDATEVHRTRLPRQQEPKVPGGNTLGQKARHGKSEGDVAQLQRLEHRVVATLIEDVDVVGSRKFPGLIEIHIQGEAICDHPRRSNGKLNVGIELREQDWVRRRAAPVYYRGGTGSNRRPVRPDPTISKSRSASPLTKLSVGTPPRGALPAGTGSKRALRLRASRRRISVGPRATTQRERFGVGPSVTIAGTSNSIGTRSGTGFRPIWPTVYPPCPGRTGKGERKAGSANSGG